MKSPKLLLPLSVLVCQAAAAQDVIIKKNGDELQAKVLEINLQEIKYKRWDNLEGPSISVARPEVFMIKFENGLKQVFSEAPQPSRPAEAPVPAQAPTPPDPMLAPEPMSLNGPRVGVTLLGPGALQDKMQDQYSAGPVFSQFGWQFESRLFTLPNGFSGLVEFVPLIGGLDQGLFLPSLNGLLGVRTGSGFELGVGPNVSVAGAALVLTAGATVQSEYVNFPVNFAVVPSPKGTRFSLLVGFNMRRK